MSEEIQSDHFEFSRHAKVRIAQRSIRTSSLDLLLLHGTPCNAGGGCEKYRLLNRTIKQLQMGGYDAGMLQSASKLCAIVTAEGRVVTCYHAAQDRRKRSQRKDAHRRTRCSPNRNL